MQKKPDYVFLAITLALMTIGTIMVFSASPALALKMGDGFYYLKRHIFYIIIGFLGFRYALDLKIQKLKKYALQIIGVAILFLLLLHVPHLGKTMGGATRWLNLYLFSFQPSEFAKFAIVVFLAATLSNLKNKIEDFWHGFFPLLLVIGLIAGIIIKQPDMGTALSIMITAFILFFIAGAKIAHLSAIGSIGVFGILILSVTSAYRIKRLFAYLDPWKDPLNVGFHIIQSLLAVGSGGLFGLGLGNSRQKFFYLPQQYADFIFAVYCEELGFIGAAFLILLFLGFLFRGLRIAAFAEDDFSSLLAVGLISMFGVQIFLNLSVVVGLIPTTGIPLPFVSYGGTAMLVNLFSVGLLLNISKAKK